MREALEDFLPKDAQLHFTEPVAHAAVDAETKGEVVAGVFAVDDEIVRALLACYALWQELYMRQRDFSSVVDGGGWVMFISPAVWTVLWIVTGSPRILPWRK